MNRDNRSEWIANFGQDPSNHQLPNWQQPAPARKAAEPSTSLGDYVLVFVIAAIALVGALAPLYWSML